MRIKKITATDIPPIKNFIADDLKDLVVIAGPNGVGKTRLFGAMLRCFQRPKSHNRSKLVTNPSFVIEATHSFESDTWGKMELDTTEPDDAVILQAFLKRSRKRRGFQNGIVNYESNRWIPQENPSKSRSHSQDPWEEGISPDMTLGGLSDRWNDTENAIFRKLEYEKALLGNKAFELAQEGHKSMPLNFSDPTTPFTDVFLKLLYPKTLIKPTLTSRKLMYMDGEQRLSIESLSSGEREVFRIVIDFILLNPAHCIVYFDEPELHLHPELLSRLITTLRDVGESNQFILATHSAELISPSLDESVIFLTPPKEDDSNQVVKIEPTGDVAEALHQLGQSVGIVSLGKKIVLIEGSEASLDKKTYSQIIQDRFPELVLLACGSKNTLSSFDSIVSNVLNQSLWGMEFFMLADRDVATGVQTSETNHFRMLSRYHLENYFLDAETLCRCFAGMADQNSWHHSVEEIEHRLRDIARSNLGYAVSLVVSNKIGDATGNISVMPKGSHNMGIDTLVDAFSDKARMEMHRIEAALRVDEVKQLLEHTYQDFEKLLEADDDTWKVKFPGKCVFLQFCGVSDVKANYLKNLYVQNSKDAVPNPFQEIIDIFSTFANRKF